MTETRDFDTDSSISESELDISNLLKDNINEISDKYALSNNFRDLLKCWNLEKSITSFENSGWTDVREWSDITENDLKTQIGLKKNQIDMFMNNYKEWHPKRMSLIRIAKQKYKERNKNNNSNNSNEKEKQKENEKKENDTTITEQKNGDNSSNEKKTNNSQTKIAELEQLLRNDYSMFFFVFFCNELNVASTNVFVL